LHLFPQCDFGSHLLATNNATYFFLNLFSFVQGALRVETTSPCPGDFEDY